MATMSTQQRQEAWAQFMAAWPEGEQAAFTKSDGQAAVDAADQWSVDNQVSYNAALPQPFRGVASQRLKAALLAFIIDKRFSLGLFS
jgi:hypothetical protein